ncbi:MAG: MATE family efflux transporter [Bacteroidetes bacterium]|nr:MAG: MATE family efflux transporter [Bacteroidota bacterium]
MLLNTYLPYYKRNLIVAIPVILSQLGQVLVSQVDIMMVGVLGTVELAAVAFANSVFMIGMLFGIGFSFGLTPLVGQVWTKKNYRASGELLRNSFFTNTMMAFLLSVIMITISFFFDHMGQDDEVVALALPYYRILVASLLPFIWFFTFKQFAEGMGNTMNAMIITLVANFLNIVLNYVLIFGKWGFEAYGLNGAGFATLLSRIMMPIVFFIVFRYRKIFWRYWVYAWYSRIKYSSVMNLIKMGVPISLQILLEVLAFALTAIMAGWLGVVPLAAHQIAIGLATVTFMIVTGISSATTIRVSHQYSHADFQGVKKATYASVHLVWVFMSFTALSFLLFRNLLPELYSHDLEVISLAAQLLIMAAVFQLFDGTQVVILGALRGLADVKHAMIYSALSYIFIGLPLGYLFAFILEWGVMGLWVGLVAGLASAALLFFRRFLHIYRALSV